jgi:23S rRNA (cytosine1962-C5)-methyltransferase
LDGASHRLCFAEADGLPGLIVDRYRIAPSAGGTGAERPASTYAERPTGADGTPSGAERPDNTGAPEQVLAVQVSTAGMDRALPLVLSALERLVADDAAAGGPAWERTGVLLDQGSSLRPLEDLPVLPKVWQRLPDGPWDGSAPTSILVAPGLAREPLSFAVDFLGGQKTGFFLDHRLNLGLASELLAAWLGKRPLGSVRILDLFCYVGQWGAVLAREAGRHGAAAEVLAVDASERALELARRNVSAQAGGPAVRVQTQRADILENLEDVPGGYDIVVCDPPALAKRRKDLPKAVRAYGKLNREALKRVRPGGLIVTCSCSGLLSEEDFRDALQRAQVQAGRGVQWVVRGSQGLDHPIRAEFPEGRYLKCWMGIVE